MDKGALSHDTLQEIKIPVILDGDLAASIMNAFTYCDQEDAWDEVAFCDHAIPKINELVLLLAKELDVTIREEK